MIVDSQDDVFPLGCPKRYLGRDRSKERVCWHAESDLSEIDMSVNTKKVVGRRKLHFDSLDEIAAEAKRLASQDVQLLGNWSLGQIFSHLAISMNRTIDGTDFRPSLFIRMLGPLMKNRFLKRGVPSGFKMPAKMAADFGPADDATVAAALEELCDAIERFKTDSRRVPHPAFGKMTDQEWYQLHLRHAEMHLGFVVPADE